jgi:hypothetical protein
MNAIAIARLIIPSMMWGRCPTPAGPTPLSHWPRYCMFSAQHSVSNFGSRYRHHARIRNATN